jgi:hypothetical protein
VSYNSLSVPLAIGAWSCELVPARDYRSPSGGSLPFIQADEQRQLDADRNDFARYFRPNYDFRRTITHDIDEIRAFVRDCLGLSGGNQFTDNDGLRRILCEAVSSGRIVPVVDRERRTPVRTARAPFAPQSWNEAAPAMRSGSGGGGAAPASRSFHQLAMDWMGLDSDGAYAYIEKYNAMVQHVEEVEARTAAARAAAASGSDDGLFGVAEAAASSKLISPNAGFGDDASAVNGEDSTPLGDARSFDYQLGIGDGDSIDVAGIPNMTGDPNSWVESGPGMKKQWRMFDSDGNAAIDIDFDSHHGQANPHAHNWDGNFRDQGWPVSILPW